MLKALEHGLQLPGAGEAAISACEARLGIRFPAGYREVLAATNGFNDEVGQGYLVLWSIGELCEAGGYDIFDFTDDRMLIGSNGGPTAYGIVAGNYVSIPFASAGPWQDEVRVLGTTFDSFVAAISAGEGY